jgi:sugar lactone lactonase YvrE
MAMRPWIGSAAVAGLVFILAACSDTSDSTPPAPAAPLLERYILSSEDSVPEGVAFDPVDRAFYATSLQGGSITRVAADGSESLFRAADNRASLLGAKVDADARRLWVCAQAVDGMDNRVWVFDLETSERVQEYLLGALATDGNCNDLVLDMVGAAYVTDPSNPYIYKLDSATESGSVFATDPLFAAIPGQILGLNGITFNADRDALVVAKLLTGQLLWVSFPEPDTIRAIDLGGEVLPAPDGLVQLDGDIYSVSNDSVTRTRLDDEETTGQVRVTEQISGLSTATLAEGDIYVIKSEVLNFVAGATLDTPFEIFRVDLAAFDE